MGARLEVISGAGAGLVTTTLVDGSYRLFGVGGAATIRVTKDGYEPQTRSVVVTDHQTFNIEVPLPAPRADLSGKYMLTITAADDCREGFGNGHVTEQARVRRYTANVIQRGPQLEVVLTGATFVVRDWTARFAGRVEPGRALFSLNGWTDDYDSDLVEFIPPSTTLVIYGTVVVATDSTTRLAGPLNGAVQVFEGDPSIPFRRPIAWCSSTNHQFVLSR